MTEDWIEDWTLFTIELLGRTLDAEGVVEESCEEATGREVDELVD